MKEKSNMSYSDVFISVSDVCEVLKICRQTFYKNADSYPFPVYHIGKKFFIPREPFDRIMGIDTTKQTKDV